MIPVISSAANVTGYIQGSVTAPGWGGEATWATVETGRGRMHALSGTERVQAQAIERDSTHRLYLDATEATEANRVIVIDGPYEGEYLVRFVDYRSAPGTNFYQIDLQFIGALQGAGSGS